MSNAYQYLSDALQLAWLRNAITSEELKTLQAKIDQYLWMETNTKKTPKIGAMP